MADLITIRDQCISDSGRFDLGVVGVSDNGMNAFINRAIRDIDQRYSHIKEEERHAVDTAIGDFLIELPSLRTIHSVWVMNGDGRVELEKFKHEELRKSFAEDFSTTTTGTPAFFAPTPIRKINVSSPSFDQEDVVSTDEPNRRGIVIMPPADGVYTITVFGKFIPDALTTDNEENYWTTYHDQAVVYRVLYLLEVSQRNMSGAQTWLAAIADYMLGVDDIIVEEESATVNQLEG